MKRILLTVAYEGTAYHGWQVQDNAYTIEGKLNSALSELTGEKIEVIGGSRTDAGVHALNNVAVFDTEFPMPGEKYTYALNSRLPEDIRVVASCEVEENFHPRHRQSRKTYVYNILNSEFPNPIKRLYYHHTYVNLDVDLMKQAAEYFIGEHDFTSFCSVNAQSDSKVRTVYSLDVSVDERKSNNAYPDKDIHIRITGNGFLYNMVRIIAGTLIEVGCGRIKPSEIEQIIEAKDRKAAGPTAPPCGLCLEKYEFY